MWINKDSVLSREVTQRTRSFLYASLAAIIARIFNLARIRFYENGVVSINLPISDQVIGARATRTTHPRVLNGFADLFSEVFEKDFQVENPFLWKTKAEVVRAIIEAGCRHLIRHSVSCTHVRDMTTLETHCGLCSQCVDRRFATLAADCMDDDYPEEMYRTDLLIGERREGEDRTLVEAFVRTAKETRVLSDTGFFTRFPEAMRVIQEVRGLRNVDAAEQIYNLYLRHANQVFDVLTQGLRTYATQINEGSLPSSCVLVLTLPDSYRSQDAEQVPQDEAAAGAESAYCRMISRDGKQNCTRAEYEAILSRASEFDMFIDGMTRHALCRTEVGKKRDEELTATEFAMVAEFIERAGASFAPSGRGWGHAATRVRLPSNCSRRAVAKSTPASAATTTAPFAGTTPGTRPRR